MTLMIMCITDCATVVVLLLSIPGSKGHAEKSAIAEHTLDQQHTIDWEDTKVLDKATKDLSSFW